MNHHILVKFQPDIDVDTLLKPISELFSSLTRIDGIHEVKVTRNCIHRPNRYDLLIKIRMDKEVLEIYDASSEHHKWKDSYGHFIEKKAIYDEED